MPDNKKTIVLLALIVGFFVFIVSVFIFFIFPPKNFPANEFVRIEKGKTASEIAIKLKTEHFIQSPIAFKVFARLLGGDQNIQAGVYLFRRPVSVINMVLKFTGHFLGYTPYKITVTEGMSNEKIANLLEKEIPHFNREEFLSRVGNLEGQLFPDTYFFSPLDNSAEIIYEMNQNFKGRMEEIKDQLEQSDKSFEEILTMASIIEREARTERDRRIISGILWKRIAKGMPLQVDATFEYFTDYNTYTITKDAMKEDSPYNTYTNKGLPPTPIANPGLDSILAALEPQDSSYFYYLTGRDGLMHYAVDFNGHKKNRRLYLD